MPKYILRDTIQSRPYIEIKTKDISKYIAIRNRSTIALLKKQKIMIKNLYSYIIWSYNRGGEHYSREYFIEINCFYELEDSNLQKLTNEDSHSKLFELLLFCSLCRYNFYSLSRDSTLLLFK